MLDTKSLFASKTFWAALAGIACFGGVAFTETSYEEIIAGGGAFFNLLAVAFRFTATKQTHIA